MDAVQAIAVLPASAARMAAVEVLLADPESWVTTCSNRACISSGKGSGAARLAEGLARGVPRDRLRGKAPASRGGRPPSPETGAFFVRPDSAARICRARSCALAGF